MGRARLEVQSQRGGLARVDDWLSLSPHRDDHAGDADQGDYQDYEANALSDDIRVARRQRTLERQRQLFRRLERRGADASLAEVTREVLGVTVHRVHLVGA
jgi:hypothetical protein